jgi:pimeloyl-ACP methyl ester carboxylesterase
MLKSTMIALSCIALASFATMNAAATGTPRTTPPIGYQDFHPNIQINYQLNRCLTGGRLEDLREIAPRIRDFEDWKRELLSLADRALAEGRTHNAAYYYRYSCFFCAPDDPDRMKTYGLFVRLIGDEYRNSGIRKFRIPYGEAFLPALRLTPPRSRGTIVMTSGFDTYLEEYIPRMEYFAAGGYDVIVFNGPGQGEAMMTYKLGMTHAWEKPVGAVLDYFRLDGVDLVGVSLGGYLAMRAAAFDARIKRVVAFNVMFDFYDCFRVNMPGFAGAFIDAALFLRMDFLVNFVLTHFRINRDMLTKWFFRQGMMVTNTDSPASFLREIKKYTLRDCSQRITQDVLLLAGSEDHYVPLAQLSQQMDALKSARSVTGRIFTRVEGAQNHGQYGNHELALATILDWIDFHAARGD